MSNFESDVLQILEPNFNEYDKNAQNIKLNLTTYPQSKLHFSCVIIRVRDEMKQSDVIPLAFPLAA